MVAVEEVSKSSLRDYAKSLRKNIKNKELLEEKIKNNVLNNKKVLKSKDILIYISKNEKIDTKKIIKELWKLNKNIYVPKVEGNIINFYLLKSFNDLELGIFNILEPITNIKYKDNKISCIIVPGLLFDKNNNRLGYGRGYYDKYLENKNIYKIGLCFSTLIVDKITIDKNDIKMDEIITER